MSSTLFPTWASIVGRKSVPAPVVSRPITSLRVSFSEAYSMEEIINKICKLILTLKKEQYRMCLEKLYIDFSCVRYLEDQNACIVELFKVIGMLTNLEVLRLDGLTVNHGNLYYAQDTYEPFMRMIHSLHNLRILYMDQFDFLHTPYRFFLDVYQNACDNFKMLYVHIIKDKTPISHFFDIDQYGLIQSWDPKKCYLVRVMCTSERCTYFQHIPDEISPIFPAGYMFGGTSSEFYQHNIGPYVFNKILAFGSHGNAHFDHVSDTIHRTLTNGYVFGGTSSEFYQHNIGPSVLEHIQRFAVKK